MKLLLKCNSLYSHLPVITSNLRKKTLKIIFAKQFNESQTFFDFLIDQCRTGHQFVVELNVLYRQRNFASLEVFQDVDSLFGGTFQGVVGISIEHFQHFSKENVWHAASRATEIYCHFEEFFVVLLWGGRTFNRNFGVHLKKKLWKISSEEEWKLHVKTCSGVLRKSTSICNFIPEKLT